ncbi:MAG: DUF2569 domain-containing protein [Thermoguttaceae bacterium]|nr:DUF2569 domain-containing protein [Thermoguttaceae bacterium]MDW8080007.1 DUF2569 family protein [Thermoguttaceae bacterium]
MSIPETARPAIDEKLKGIGGWLLVPAIGMTASVIIGWCGLPVITWSLLDVESVNPGSLVYMTIKYIVELGLLWWCTLLLFDFFAKKKEFPRLIITFLACRVAVFAACLCLGLIVFVGEGKLVTMLQVFADQQHVGGLGAYDHDVMFSTLVLLNENDVEAAAFAAAIWVPYFKFSKRVKATFVN